MITQINTTNKDEYDKLFADALADLHKLYPNQYQLMGNKLNADNYQPGVYYIVNSEDPSGYTLAVGPYEEGVDYYQLLVPTTISTLPEYFALLGTLKDISTKYVVLPLDEEYFSIDANTRIIDIPKPFKQNGVGVQGDHGAEVLYFKINRFFDAMDFGRDDVDIIIQWETTDSENPKGTSWAFCKDIVSDPDYVTFGWELNNKITKAGVVKFAVRIVVWTDTTKTTYKYSFSTLTASVAINPALQLTGVDLIPTDDVETSILDRIANSPTPSQILKLNAPSFIYPNKSISIDLEPDQNGDYSYTLKACAYPNPQGLVNYKWRLGSTMLPNNGNNKTWEYVELNSKNDYNENITYYVMDENGKYSVKPISNPDTDIVIDEDTGKISPTLYYQEGQRVITSAGVYEVEAQCSGGNFALSDITKNKYTWTVPAPEEIQLINNNNEYIDAIDNGDKYTLTINDIKSNIVNADKYHGFEFTWNRNGLEGNTIVIDINDANDVTTKREKQGEYSVNIVGIKNNTRTLNKNVNKNYILLLPAEIPYASILVNNSSLNSTNANIDNTLTAQTFTPGEGTSYQLGDYTNFYYTWYKSKSSTIIKINNILNDENRTPEAKIRDIEDALKTAAIVVSEEAEDNSTLKLTDSGYYCCKVTNRYGTTSSSYYTPVCTVI